MRITNSHSTYGWLAIILHWISAVGVIWLYFLGEDIEHAKADELGREAILHAIRFHVSIGLLFIAFLFAFVLSKLLQKKPQPYAQHKYLNWLSQTVLWLWIVLITTQIVTGPLTVFSSGRPLKLFDWIAIPSPMERNEQLHEVAEWIHAHAPNLFWPLIVLHVAGALKHLLIDRDKTVQRMIKPQRD